MEFSYDVIPLFSTPIYYVNDVEYNLTESETKCVESIYTSSNVNFLNNNFFLSSDVYVLRNLSLKGVKEICQKHLDFYTKEVLHIKQDFYITNSWITVKSKNQFHHQHNHQNCIFSGVFYVNAEENVSELCFHGIPGYLKNFHFDYNYKEGNLFNSFVWKFPVKTGTIIIFPSHVDHSVIENNTDTNRIVIGFNSFVKGNFGVECDNTYCSQLRL